MAAALRSGSTPWLLVHELRLALRATTSRRGARLSLSVLLIGLVVLAVFAGLPVAVWVRRAPPTLTLATATGIDLALLVIFTLILSQTLAAAVTIFYERGDLDLLLSSPLPPARALAVKAVSVAMTPFLWFSLFLTPFILPLAVFGMPKWLCLYAILGALALLAGALGMAIAMGLFRLIGPRATRTVGQLLAALVGAGFFLVTQARTLLPDGGAAAMAVISRWSTSGAFSPDAPLSWPARAVLGEPLALGLVLLLAAAAFMAVSWALGRRFSHDAAAAAAVRQTAPAAKTEPAGPQGFQGGVFTVMLRKELRLILRDPTLLSQVLLRTLYVLPLTFLLVRNASGHGGHAGGPAATGPLGSLGLAAGAGAVVFMAGQIAGSLAWITLSAEDAPELIACAPVDGARVRRAKLTATLLPVAVLMSLPIGALLALKPWIGAVAGVAAALSAASAGLINLWFEKPAERKAFRSRRGGSVLGASAELVLGLGWGAAAALAAGRSVWAVLPAAASLLALAGLRALSNPKRGY
jgi:ABC-2 type transport system permease protein